MACELLKVVLRRSYYRDCSYSCMKIMLLNNTWGMAILRLLIDPARLNLEHSQVINWM